MKELAAALQADPTLALTLATAFEVSESTVTSWAKGKARPHWRIRDQVLAKLRELRGDDGVAKRLLEHARKFIADQKISGAESVYQSDRVIENGYAFIEGCGDIVGWYKDPDDTDDEDA